LATVFGVNSPHGPDIVITALKVADAPLYCVPSVTAAVLFQESGLFIVQINA